MPLVRTDRSALVAGGVIVALFTLEVVRTGLVIAAQDRSSLDAWVMLALAAGAMYATLFWFAHSWLRQRGLRSRGAYAAIGAAAALPPFLLAVGWVANVSAWQGGTLSALLVCPLVTGALMGFLYHRRAGYEFEDDDIDALAAAVSTEPASPNGSRPLEHAGILRTERTEYYGGPLVVGDSLPAGALASLLAGAVFILCMVLADRLDPYVTPLGEFMAFNGPGKTVLQGIIGTALPIGGLLAIAHAFLRARRRHSYKDYAVAGAIGPAIIGALIGMTGISVLAFLYTIQFLAPSLVAMLAYRRLAGLEPAPVPEDIEVRDRRNLAGTDHVRRRVSRVIDNTR